MFENGRKVWWPIEYREYNESGEQVTRKIVICYLLETAAQRKERAKAASTTMLADARKRIAEIVQQQNAKDADGKPLNPADSTDQLREQLERIDELDRAERAHNISRIVDWRGIEIDGEAAEFSEQHRDQLMAFDDWANVLAQGYIDCCKGAVAKN